MTEVIITATQILEEYILKFRVPKMNSISDGKNLFTKAYDAINLTTVLVTTTAIDSEIARITRQT